MLDFKLYPYCEIDGVHTFHDSEIKELYYKMLSDKDNIYRDNCITNADDFLKHMKYEAALYVGYYGDEAFGFIYLDHFEAKTARAHFYVFKAFRGRPENIEVSKSILRTIFDAKYNGVFLYNTLIGLIPSDNKIGRHFLKKLGGIILGIIPNSMWDEDKARSVDGTVVYFIR